MRPSLHITKLKIASAGSGVALLVAALAVIGWKQMIPWLLSPIAGLPQTSPVNACLLIVLALSLLLGRQVVLGSFTNLSRVTCQLLTLAVLGVALYVLMCYALRLPMEFDDHAGPLATLGDVPLPLPGPPSPHSAATVVFLCCALICAVSRGRRRLRAAAGLAAVSMIIPWIALFGYASGFDPFYALPSHPQTGMGIYTAFAMLALAMGIMGLDPDAGLLGLWRSRDIGGTLTRWLLPVAAGGPLLFGQMAVKAQEAGYFNSVAGFALICVVNAVVLAALTTLVAGVLDSQAKARNRAAAERDRLLMELHRSTEDLRELQKGFVTVCAWTRRVLDGGRWVEFEEFMQSHLHLRFSHGMSAEAAENMRREFEAMQTDSRFTAHVRSEAARNSLLPSCEGVLFAQGGAA